ncbi:MAG TPA: hypothetical protein VGM01_01075, partial [Ktedonobacteraceae bacterium]
FLLAGLKLIQDSVEDHLHASGRNGHLPACRFETAVHSACSPSRDSVETEPVLLAGLKSILSM